MHNRAAHATSRGPATTGSELRPEDYTRLFRGAPVGLALVAPDGTILEANPAYHRLLGYPPGALVGRDVFALTHPDDLERSRAMAERLYAGEVDHYTIEKRYLRADGEPVWILLSVAAVRRDERGGVVLMLGLIQDISERKRAEEALHRSLEDLGRSNTDLEQFAYTVSHDLKSPLQAVQGCLQTLLRRADGLDETNRELAEHAVGGAQRMHRLIDRLLTLARAQTAPLRPQQVDAAAVADEVLAALAAEIDAVGAEVDVCPLPTATADPDLLALVLQNLLANALTHAGPSPRIRLEGERRPGETVLAVRDSGPGVAPDERERIFGMFEGAGRSTGIGLATCQRVVARHGGRIWVEDAPGGGARFVLTLPDRAPPPPGA